MWRFEVIVPLGPNFLRLMSKGFISCFLDGGSRLFDKIKQEPEVVQSGDAGSGRFFDLHQVPQVGATKAIRHGI